MLFSLKFVSIDLHGVKQEFPNLNPILFFFLDDIKLEDVMDTTLKNIISTYQY